MKLKLPNDYIQPELYQELGFAEYLSLFDHQLPILPHHILAPFDKEEGEAFFSDLRSLNKEIIKHGLCINELLDRTSALPFLEHVLPFFKNQELQQYHLFEIGSFLARNKSLMDPEKKIPLDLDSKSLKKIEKILGLALSENFSSLNLSKQEANLQREIQALENKLSQELTALEKEIHTQTGLQMTYPYPREIEKGSRTLEQAEACPLLRLSPKQEMVLVEFNLPKALISILCESDKKREAFQELLREKLAEVNKQLNSFYDRFASYYQSRKKRCLQYSLLKAAKDNNLTLPDFTEENSFHLLKGHLPALKRITEDYVPLTINLERGASVLFGANLAGKTTTLKTIYFILSLIRFGLPVPSEKIVLKFPEEINLLLKSSGDIRTGTSSFSSELEFLSQTEKSKGYILLDELLQSTNPISGASLSKIFLSEFSKKDTVFFCTSQYPEVLGLTEIDLYRMHDNLDLDDHFHLNKMPYTLNKVSANDLETVQQESRKPLLVALNYPFSESIKGKIEDQLSGGEE